MALLRIFCRGRNFFEAASFHLWSVWLFTLSDIKTIVLPSTIFAVIHGIVASRLGMTQTPINWIERLPLTLFWTWINLLPFAIDNQRQRSSILEDASNKSWRPLPSRRMTSSTATRLMFASYALALVCSIQLAAWQPCLALMIFGWCYNDLGGADFNCIIRNLINGLGYTCFTSGALLVAVRGDGGIIRELEWWFQVLFLIICTTVQCQDMSDQEGDAARRRKTAPLVVGDAIARFTIAIPVLGWSIATPWLWSWSILAYVAPVLLGLVVACRILSRRNKAADRQTFRIWNMWLVSLYCIPLLHAALPGSGRRTGVIDFQNFSGYWHRCSQLLF